MQCFRKQHYSRFGNNGAAIIVARLRVGGVVTIGPEKRSSGIGQPAEGAHRQDWSEVKFRPRQEARDSRGDLSGWMVT